MRTLAILSVLSTLVLGAANSAEAKDHASQDVAVFSFSDEVVHGDLVRPDVGVISGRARGSSESLIRIRTHFVPELYESVEEL